MVIGLGNLVMSDDAVGLEAIRRLEASYALPQGVDVLDGGTLGLDLLVHLEGYGALLIADCVATGGAAGDVYRIGRDEVEAVFGRCLSPHQVGLQDLLALLELQGRLPSRVTVVGVEPASLAPGVGLSEVVQASLGEVVRALAGELRGWGHTMEGRRPGADFDSRLTARPSPGPSTGRSPPTPHRSAGRPAGA